MGSNFFVSVYSNLLTLYHSHLQSPTSSNKTVLQEKCFLDLPEGIKNRINSHISHPVDGVDFKPGQVQIFDSPTLFQEAIRLTAFEIFDTISQPERSVIGNKIWEYAKFPQTDDPQWGEHHAKDDVPILLKSLNHCLGDLTPQLEIALNDWIAQEGENISGQLHHSLNVLKTIKAFLKGDVLFPNMLENWGCRADHQSMHIYANVSSLPPVFDQRPFISRLFHFTAKYNRLAAIPQDICKLSELITLEFSNENSQDLMNNSILLQ